MSKCSWCPTTGEVRLNAGGLLFADEDCADRVPTDALSDVLFWLEATLAVIGLSDEIKQAIRCISTLIQAVKEYSYIDQAPLQEVDVHAGLESTLIILGHKLKGGIVVTRATR